MPSRLSQLLLLAVLPAALSAQSSVWKVTKNNATVYLGGTLHLLRPTDKPPAEFDQAFAASDKIIFEADVSAAQSPEMQRKIMKKGMYTDGTTLQKTLSPKAWEALEAYLTKAGLPVNAVNSFKPWMVTVMIAGLELQKLHLSAQGVDMIYHLKAREAGKSLGELETLDAQIDFLANMGAGKESELVLKTIDDLAKIEPMLEKAITAWKTGDMKGIDEALLADMRKDYPDLYREGLIKRNQAWLPKIEALFATPEIEFVLAGVGHMAGKDSLLDALKAKGYKIEQIKATAPAPAAAANK